MPRQFGAYTLQNLDHLHPVLSRNTCKFAWPHTYHDCQANICKAYEQNFFRQLGEIRFERHSSYSSEIQIWRIAILAQVLRIWESDPKGQHLQLLKNEIKITNVIFQ